MEQLSKDQLEYLRQLAKIEACRKHYQTYVEHVHRGLWFAGKHLKYICKDVESLLAGTLYNDIGNEVKILLLSVPPQHGKKVKNSIPVLTTRGWVPHGDIRVGDWVYGRDGTPKKVLAELNHSITPDCDYNVTFTDGSTITTHVQHEWVVYDRWKGKEVILETQQMYNSKYFSGNRCRYQVDNNVLIEFEEKSLPVDPYTLGAWLGDGTTVASSITHHKDDTEVIANLEITKQNIHPTTGVIRTYFKSNLRDIGFAKKKGSKKHIPNIYKLSSSKQRLELLAGLIDTDGYVYQKNGRITFSNINKTLIDDVSELCISLGFRTTISEFLPITSTSGIVGKNIVYQLSFNPDMSIPTRIPRKKVTNITPAKRRRGITSITPCTPEMGKCITVEGGVYLVGRTLIPTHNSQCITETLPSWYLGNNPDKRVIIASYNTELAAYFGRRNISKIQEFGHDIFNLSLSKETSDNFEVQGNIGACICRGIMSGITGKPGDLIIVDDPIKNREEADSETYRDKLWNEYLNSIKTRLSATGKIIVIQTRWHESDLIGRILENEGYKAKYINFPCEAEESDLLGRPIGDALFPEIGKDNEWLKDFKLSYMSQEGSRAWQALFQGHPSALQGNLLRREWWRYYDTLPTQLDRICQSWDCTFKDSATSDYVVGQVWGMKGIDCYLIDQVRARMDFPTTLAAIESMKAKYPSTQRIFIEDKANGSAIISILQSKISGVIPVNPEGGKIARVNAISAHIESGHVFLPKFAAFLDDFLTECSMFPNGSNDDVVDCLSQALNRMMYYHSIDKPIIHYREGGHYLKRELLAKGFKEHEILKMAKQGKIKILGR